MHLVAIAWIYVVLMMSVAEATNSTGTLLGAIVTFVLYGVLPLAIVMYLLRTPARRAARRTADSESVGAVAANPDGGDHAPGDAIAPERKEP